MSVLAAVRCRFGSGFGRGLFVLRVGTELIVGLEPPVEPELPVEIELILVIEPLACVPVPESVDVQMRYVPVDLSVAGCVCVSRSASRC